MNKLEEVSEELKELEEQEQTLRNKIYVLTSEHSKLSQEECKKDIGRCFKKIDKTSTVYIKIIDVGEIKWGYRGNHFNEYQHPSIQFKYPYDNSKFPFIEDGIHSNAWNRKDNEVNSEWIKSLSNI